MFEDNNYCDSLTGESDLRLKGHNNNESFQRIMTSSSSDKKNC